MNITLFSKPACQQCTASERKLTKNKVVFSKVNLETEPETLAALKEDGYMQAPILEVTDEAGNRVDIWSGFRPDKIDEYFPAPAKQLAAA